MKNTKAFILIAVLLLSLGSFAQDTTKTKVPKERCSITNEIGLNTTYLLKQILSLSGNQFQLLPYDLTYKMIFKHSAIRIGAGAVVSNSTTSNSTTVVIPSTTTIPGPDQLAPNINNSATVYYRAGWEHRFLLGQRFLVYAGLDLVGQYGKIVNQYSSLDNGLPNDYYFYKNNSKSITTAYGGGPVAGMQFFFTKSLSVFTEVPLYFQYSYQKVISDNYQNEWEYSNTTYTYAFVATETKRTNKSKTNGFQLTLPVTIYLSLKF